MLMPWEGVFKSCALLFRIDFEDYPNAIPKITFQSGVLHPYVSNSPSGSNFDVHALVPEWSLGTRVYSLLNAILDCFIEIPVPQKAFNPDAVRYFKEGPDVFAKKALEMLPSTDKIAAESEFDLPKGWTRQREQLIAGRGKRPAS
jgi:ubiquitin-protein ligase